jgi:DedD protein
MAESEEALQLKRRARRRLVGAIALVTFVVIILPLILDKEPGPTGPPLDVQIPKQESGGFTSRAVPPALPVPAAPSPEKKVEVPAVIAEPFPATAEPSQVKPGAPAARAEPAVAQKAVKAPTPPTDKTERERAHAASGDQTWVVMLEAFSNAANVKQLQTRLSAAGVKSYTEAVRTSKGELTRVRAGPFASREAAENARAKLDAMGLKPGAVASR